MVKDKTSRRKTSFSLVGLILSSLISQLCVSQSNSKYDQCSELIRQILFQPFMAQAPYGKSFLNSLVQVDKTSVSKKVGIEPDILIRLDNAITKFDYPSRQDSKVFVKSGWYTDPRLQSLVLIVSFFGKAKKAPLGYASWIISKDKTGSFTVEIAGVYSDLESKVSRGITAPLLALIEESLLIPLQTKRVTLKADYLGRYVWAKQGFQFDNSYWYFKTIDQTPQKTLKIIDIARANFGRFIQKYDVDLSSLVIRRGNADVAVSSLQDFLSASDFANVHSKEGRTIRLRPLLGHDTFGAMIPMSVGKAFMLADYRYNSEEHGQTYIQSMSKTKFSAYAMPYWNGVKR